MPTLTIDNLKIDVPAGTKVIEAAERLGIMIPRFCFHPALGSVGACRVCAVSFVEGPIKGIQMSCMIEAQDQMVVSTTDADAVDFRRQVIELLMLHHPHDCPVCDEGGHCLLQDLTVAGGHGRRRYRGLKRTHVNQDLGPLVQHEMNRCIQCYRCSRYYQEFTGYRDLGVMGIGSRVYFGRSTSGTLESPFSGNLTDICPTGVYTDKPSRFFGRRWDYERQATVCIHCALGCNLTASARYRQVVRHEARANDAVNGHFICDRGRYAYAYASAADRPRQPLNAGQTVPMAEALSTAGAALRSQADRHGPDRVAMLASARGSLETLVAARTACDLMGWRGPSTAPTHRQAGNIAAVVDSLDPDLAVGLADLATAHDVLVVGADPLNESPMLALALRQVVRRGGGVTVIDPRGVQLPFDFDHWAVDPMGLTVVLKALIDQIGGDRATAAVSGPWGALDAAGVQTLAKCLNSSPRPVVVCGSDIVTPTDIHLAARLARALCRTHIKAGLFYTLTGANAFACGLIGQTPVAVEQMIAGIEAGDIRALVVVEADPWVDYPDRPRLEAALDRLVHLVVLDYVDTPLSARADLFIPTQTLYEAGGHWINNEGRLQAARPLLAGGDPLAFTGGGDHPPRIFESEIPGGAPLPAWQALMSLAGKDEAEGHRCLDAAMTTLHLPVGTGEGRCIDHRDASQPKDTEPSVVPPESGPTADDRITLLLVDETFGTEPLAARSPTLAELQSPPQAGLNPATLERLGLTAGRPLTVATAKGCFSLECRADPRIAPGVMVVPRHHRLAWQVVDDTRVTLGPAQIQTGDG